MATAPYDNSYKSYAENLCPLQSACYTVKSNIVASHLQATVESLRPPPPLPTSPLPFRKPNPSHLLVSSRLYQSSFGAQVHNHAGHVKVTPPPPLPPSSTTPEVPQIKHASSTSGVAWTVRRKSATNQARLYWYMGSTPAKSAMQKKSRLALTATGRYCSLAASISCSVRSASSTLLAMSLLVACRSQGKVKVHADSMLHW